MDAASFSTGQGCPVEKPRNPTAHLEGRRPGRRVIRGAISFGYFSLLRASCSPPFGPASPFARARSACVGKQRKVPRPPVGGRKPAAGEPDRRIATTEDCRYWMTSHAAVGERFRPAPERRAKENRLAPATSLRHTKKPASAGFLANPRFS